MQARAHSRPMPLAAPVRNTPLFSSSMRYTFPDPPFDLDECIRDRRLSRHGRAHVAPEDVLHARVVRQLRRNDEVVLDGAFEQTEPFSLRPLSRPPPLPQPHPPPFPRPCTPLPPPIFG